MIYNFKKTLNLKSHINLNHVNLHLSFIEHKSSAIDDIINYAQKKPDGEKHIEFLLEYKSQIAEHISTIKQTIIETESLSNELTKFLDVIKKEEYTKNDAIKLGNRSFYISYYKGEFTFISHINYDDYLQMDVYYIFTYLYDGKKLKLQNSSIGYTDKTLSDLRNYPSLLLQEIEKMDTLARVKDVNAQFSKCQDLLKQLFNLNNVVDIFSFNDPYYTEFFGNPREVLSLMIHKRVNNIIKLQLEQNKVSNITPNLIDLIIAENRYRNHTFDEEYDTKESFDKRTKELINEKSSLMNSLQITQDVLDDYMNFIDLEK